MYSMQRADPAPQNDIENSAPVGAKFPEGKKASEIAAERRAMTWDQAMAELWRRYVGP
jgi:hypothetical protein